MVCACMRLYVRLSVLLSVRLSCWLFGSTDSCAFGHHFSTTLQCIIVRHTVQVIVALMCHCPCNATHCVLPGVVLRLKCWRHCKAMSLLQQSQWWYRSLWRNAPIASVVPDFVCCMPAIGQRLERLLDLALQGSRCAKPEAVAGEDVPQGCFEAGQGGAVGAHPQQHPGGPCSPWGHCG